MSDPDSLEQRTEWQESCYDQEMDALDVREQLADEDRDAIELRTALIDIASTRIGAFGVMV